MIRLTPYYGISLAIHAAVVAAVAGLGWFGSNPAPQAQGTGSHPNVLMIVGNPVPTVASAPAVASEEPTAPSLAQPLEQSLFPVRPFAQAKAVLQQVDPSPPRSSQSSQASLANPPGHSGAASEEGGGGIPDGYLIHIRQRIEGCKKYPPLAWRAGEEGEMTFSIGIDKEGKIARLDVLSNRCSQRLLAAGRRAIENAAPFNQPPSHWKDGLTVRVPIRFTISLASEKLR